MPHIKVSQKHIDDAIPADSAHCMIADGIKESLPHVKHISVDIGSIRYSDPKKGLRYTFLTPRPAQWALVQYDQGVKPEPFNFDLRGGQRTTMHPGDKKTGKQKAAHKLGRRRLVKRKPNAAQRAEQEVVGGRPPPNLASLRKSEAIKKGLEKKGKGKKKKTTAAETVAAVLVDGQPPKLRFGARRAFGLRAMPNPYSRSPQSDISSADMEHVGQCAD